MLWDSVKPTWQLCSHSSSMVGRLLSRLRICWTETIPALGQMFSAISRVSILISNPSANWKTFLIATSTRYQNVFIDESHRFRTETTQSYEMLAQICRGKRVILVSATPLNNTPRDMLSQIKLFQNGKNRHDP